MIRQLIREMLLAETLADVAGERSPMPIGIEQDMEAGGGLGYAKDQLTLDYRRDTKKLWNKYADHNFFQDPNKFFVWHTLGLFSGNDKLSGYLSLGSGGKIPGIHVPNKNELSCFGILPKPYGGRTWGPDQSMSYFTFKKYRVTFACKYDAASERLSRATPADVEKHKHSGLSKRPGVYTGHEGVPLDQKDVEAMSDSRGLGEVIIDNWIVDTFYCHQDDIEAASAIGLKCKALESSYEYDYD